NLRCATRDAHDVADVLRRYYGFGNVSLLTDAQATRTGILDALDAALDLTDRESLLIYYAGHGWMDRRKNGYWVPSDARHDKKSDYISINAIVGDYLRKYEVKHLLVVSDSCFSGTMLRGKGEDRTPDWKLPSGFRKPSRWVLTSGDLQPVPDGAALHSPVAERFLQFLKYSNTEAFGVQDLYVYLRRLLASEAICQPLKSEAHMPGGEFVFCRLNKPLDGGSVATQPDIAVPVGISGPSVVPLFGQLSLKTAADGFASINGGKQHAIRRTAGLNWNKLAVDTYVVRVTSGDKEWKKTVEIADGKTTSIKAVFGPSPGQDLVVDLGGGTDLELVWIEPGSFMMGSPSSEEDRGSDETLHRVTLTKGFWMGKYELTQEQWQQVMGSNPSKFKGTKNPVEQVSWDDCQEFLRKLNGKGVEGAFSLPTEAQWEYACRAGTTGAYAGSLDAMAWYGSNAGSKTQEIGAKRPNAWGLSDMHGNVWEWCQDRYGKYPTSSVTDPVGASSGSYRVLRGGSWINGAGRCRSARRDRNFPANRLSRDGLRVVLFR
ncbi:MAG: formylglycine-generating enzyme family protein, partial [Kiritimatiellia bacterium]|nr:formylglycine-generating enzyme family protein [Kiritimatiellia bacterium]